MQIELTQKEATTLMDILGELPNKTNSYPLLLKIATQVKGQLEIVKQPEEPVEATG